MKQTFSPDFQALDALFMRFLAGETSREEEQALQAFFASSDVPAEWADRKALFAYFDAKMPLPYPAAKPVPKKPALQTNEPSIEEPAKKPVPKKPALQTNEPAFEKPRRKRRWWLIPAAVAAAACLLAVFLPHRSEKVAAPAALPATTASSAAPNTLAPAAAPLLASAAEPVPARPVPKKPVPAKPKAAKMPQQAKPTAANLQMPEKQAKPTAANLPMPEKQAKPTAANLPAAPKEAEENNYQLSIINYQLSEASPDSSLAAALAQTRRAQAYGQYVERQVVRRAQADVLRCLSEAEPLREGPTDL